MNAALRVLRNELAWLAEARRTALANPDGAPRDVWMREVIQINRERREVVEAIEIIQDAQKPGVARGWSPSPHVSATLVTPDARPA